MKPTPRVPGAPARQSCTPAVPFIDLARSQKPIEKTLEAAARNVLRAGRFVRGPVYQTFTQRFARYCQTNHCVGLANGTDALYLALRALEIGPGDEIITSPFTFFATAETIAAAGAKPVFADINPATWTIDPAAIRQRLSVKTKAILPVHIFGNPADMDAVLDIARRRELFVIEDACQAHGALYKGKKTGSLGDAGCFSFYPTKNLGACGDAGGLVTNNKEIADRVWRLADHGSREKYSHLEVGINSRLDDLQAAILNVKLDHLDQWNNQRREAAAAYRQLLKNISGIVLPQETPGGRAVYHVFSITTKRRDALRQHLGQRQIAAQVYYPTPLHLLPALKNLGHKPGSFPVSEKLAEEILALPLFPGITNKEIERVCGAIGEFFSN
ncbi:MAG: DegT/DnrJ/EryC1/StrS family aminotransferase [Elusimicrobia bacterium]|nr:DegT/DnrJ/EryC1/StrS family aminotransferase [Elusimicrobiota bacterium]